MAPSTEQKDLHKELSALRVALENVTIMATGSNVSLVQWKVWEHCFRAFQRVKEHMRCLIPVGFSLLSAPVLPIPAALP